MSRPDFAPAGIPVQTLAKLPHSDLAPTVAAVLHEVQAMLGALIADGESHSIDLRHTPLAPDEHAQLEEALGKGELSATLNLLGPSHVIETAIAGVWWIKHCNREGQVIGEFIEVTACPDILVTQPADLQAGLERLKARMTRRATPATDPRDVAASLEALGLGVSPGKSHPQSNSRNGSNGNAG